MLCRVVPCLCHFYFVLVPCLTKSVPWHDMLCQTKPTIVLCPRRARLWLCRAHVRPITVPCFIISVPRAHAHLNRVLPWSIYTVLKPCQTKPTIVYFLLCIYSYVWVHCRLMLIKRKNWSHKSTTECRHVYREPLSKIILKKNIHP